MSQTKEMVDIVDVLEQAKSQKFQEWNNNKLQAAVQKKEDLDCLKGKLVLANTNANSVSWEMVQVMMMLMMVMMMMMMMMLNIIKLR